jgi:hypothetical protein
MDGILLSESSINEKSNKFVVSIITQKNYFLIKITTLMKVEF